MIVVVGVRLLGDGGVAVPGHLAARGDGVADAVAAGGLAGVGAGRAGVVVVVLLLLGVALLGVDQVVALVRLPLHRLESVEGTHLHNLGGGRVLVGRVVEVAAGFHPAAEELHFLLNEEELLGAEDRARPRDADPPDELFSRDLEVLHGVQPDQGARAPQARLAVNGDRARVRLAEVTVTDVQEVLHNIFRWV